MSLDLRFWLHRLRRRHVGFALLLFAATTLYNEHLSYSLQNLYWPDMQPNRSEVGELRMLLVADPQITGYRDNVFFLPYSLISWDSDRYLKRTFQHAFDYASADVVVFLGDLMDEGTDSQNKMAASNSSQNLEFLNYNIRFHNIFAKALNSKNKIQIIYIPGDNDVGGEELDLKTSNKIKFFQEAFPNTNSPIRSKFIDFFPLSYDIGEGTKNIVAMLEEATKSSTATYRVLLNHMPLLERTYFEFFRIIKASFPSLIISAHTHKSQLYVCDDCEIDVKDSSNEIMEAHDSLWEGQKRILQLNQIYKLRIGKKSLVEIVVPTSSYRMGTNTIG